jgi:DNA-binding MarR family transcriptional regulator
MQATDAKPQASSEAVARQLLDFWMFIVRKSAGSRMFAVLAELDIGFSQMKTLHMLDGCREELSVKELSEHLGVSLPGASRLTDGLLRRGWAERREDERDRRIKRVRITQEGRAVVTRINEARLEGLEEFTASMSDTQRDGLSRALAALDLEED